MTTYTRRGPGQGYLKTVLSEQINYVTSKLRDVDLEINPLKVYETMMAERASIRGSTSSLPPGGITAEEAAVNPQVQAIISRRVGQLIQLANYFLDTIVNGMDETPYGIRWICKQIRSLSRRKYPDAQDQTICTLIGGFFFLRFINPAIVTPRSYMLIEQNPAENPKRTLTLVRLHKLQALKCSILTSYSPGRKNAPELGQQALLRQRTVHGRAPALHPAKQRAHE